MKKENRFDFLISRSTGYNVGVHLKLLHRFIFGIKGRA